MWLRLFTIGFPPNQHLMFMKPTTKDLQQLAALIDEHSVKPIIAMNLPFNAENLQKGFEQLKSRRTVGKIVFSMEEEGEG